MTRRYAEDTKVSTDRSRAEIEGTLRRYGASAFMSGWNDQNAYIAFQLHEKAIKFVLPMPSRKDKQFWQIEGRYKQRSEAVAYKMWEQARRQRWRALGLCIKAKLEAVEAGICSFEESFLPHFVLPSGKTVAEEVIPQIQGGRMPRLALPFENKVLDYPQS